MSTSYHEKIRDLADGGAILAAEKSDRALDAHTRIAYHDALAAVWEEAIAGGVRAVLTQQGYAWLRRYPVTNAVIQALTRDGYCVRRYEHGQPLAEVILIVEWSALGGGGR